MANGICRCLSCIFFTWRNEKFAWLAHVTMSSYCIFINHKLSCCISFRFLHLFPPPYIFPVLTKITGVFSVKTLSCLVHFAILFLQMGEWKWRTSWNSGSTGHVRARPDVQCPTECISEYIRNKHVWWWRVWRRSFWCLQTTDRADQKVLSQVRFQGVL